MFNSNQVQGESYGVLKRAAQSDELLMDYNEEAKALRGRPRCQAVDDNLELVLDEEQGAAEMLPEASTKDDARDVAEQNINRSEWRK